MSSSPQGPKNEKRGGKLVPALCSIAGTLILLGVIAFYLPVSIAHAKGYEVYNVVSGSMEPELPVGSVVYTAPVEPEEIRAGDIITFRRAGGAVTHRVTENRREERELSSKGDANAREDPLPVPYEAVEGRVFVSIPGLGALYPLFSGTGGKLLLSVVLAGGGILSLSGRRKAGKEGGSREEGE